MKRVYDATFLRNHSTSRYEGTIDSIRSVRNIHADQLKVSCCLLFFSLRNTEHQAMSVGAPTFCRSCCPTLLPRISSSVLPSIRQLTSLAASRRLQSTPPLPILSTRPAVGNRTIPQTFKMVFSNTETPTDKPADPYKAENKTEPDLKEKVEDLVKFIEASKFGMMTTRIESSGLLTSRCMAMAAKVGGCTRYYIYFRIPEAYSRTKL